MSRLGRRRQLTPTAPALIVGFFRVAETQKRKKSNSYLLNVVVSLHLDIIFRCAWRVSDTRVASHKAKRLY